MPKVKKFYELSRSQKNRRVKNAVCPVINADAGNRNLDKCIMSIDDTNSSVTKICTSEHECVNVSEVDTQDDLYDDRIETMVTSDSSSTDLSQHADSNSVQCTTNDEYNFCDNCRKVSNSLTILSRKLPKWAVTFNLPHNSITALLRLLREAGIDTLPSDARTLLGTPRKCVVLKTNSGEYMHYGLERALKQQLRFAVDNNIDQNLQIDINVDGLPISKSSKSALWPILGRIVHPSFSKPFVIGIFHGFGKPSQPEEILEKFCTEYLKLRQDGFMHSHRKYTLTIRAVICDAPARAFLTCTVGHNGYFGCTKCEVEGEYINHRMAFLRENAQLRTDENFKNRTDPDHHKRQEKSPFEIIFLSMVTQFLLDYMHLVCLGVVKKVIHLWMGGCKTVKFSALVINQLSEELRSLSEWIPIEFARTPRGLDDYKRWKATEFRMFLLYIGPVILQQYLPDANMKHFNVLHCAIRILCDPNDYKCNNKYAHELLLYYVKAFKILYGLDHVTYNVHNLIHLPTDALKFGPLDSFSCFPFENYLKDLKNLLRKGEKPLSQLSRRLDEMENSRLTELKNSRKGSAPLLLNPNNRKLPLNVSSSHDRIRFENFVISCKRKADNCCYLKDGSICRVTHIGIRDDHPVILGKVLLDPQSLPHYPCNSLQMKICCGNKWSELKEISITKIIQKAVRLPSQNYYYFFPLLHLSK